MRVGVSSAAPSAKFGAKGAGSDVLVPILLTEQRVIAQPPAVTMVTGTIGGHGGPARCELPLPPAVSGLANGKREYQIEIRQPGADGKTLVALRAPQSGTGSITFPWSGTVRGQGWSINYAAALQGDKVVMTATMGGM